MSLIQNKEELGGATLGAAVFYVGSQIINFMGGIDAGVERAREEVAVVEAIDARDEPSVLPEEYGVVLDIMADAGGEAHVEVAGSRESIDAKINIPVFDEQARENLSNAKKDQMRQRFLAGAVGAGVIGGGSYPFFRRSRKR